MWRATREVYDMTAAVATNLYRTLTPAHYAQVSTAVTIPKKRFVGLLRCQLDPLQTQLDTLVVACTPRQPKSKKDKLEYEVELEDTVLFPLGGGQPSDCGTLEVLADDGEPTGKLVQVREVLRRQLDAIHYCSDPVEIGKRVRVRIDPARRRDLMTMHTGQHLLSAIFEHDFKLDTLSWCLTPHPEPSYVELPRAPTPDELRKVQERCNEEIAANRSITVEVTPLEQQQRPDSMPADYHATESTQGVVRVVDIQGLDRNPCCGTHLPSLSFLSSVFVLPQTTSIRGTNARVYFLVGQRVLDYLSSVHEPLRAASSAMGCAPSDLPARVEGALTQTRDLTRDKKRLQEECAELHAERILSRAVDARGSILLQVSGLNDMNFLNLLSHKVTEGVQGKDHLFVLATGPSPGPGQDPGAMVIVGSEALVKAASAQVKTLFGDRVKGGGKGRWQGKVQKWQKGDEDLLRQLSEVTAVQ